MQLFFEPNLKPADLSCDINAQESNHILKVLRKKIGDKIMLTNGLGYKFSAVITDSNSKKCKVKILQTVFEKPLSYQLHLGISPPKSTDRFAFLLEKATEIGVSEITPLLCLNSERKRINFDRSYKIMQSAMKQSQRLYLPKLNDMTPFSVFINNNIEDSVNLIAHCEKTNKKNIKDIDLQSHHVCCLIGPEGDFSTKEIEIAKTKKFLPISLGDKRLRTETAGIYVCQAVALQFG